MEYWKTQDPEFPALVAAYRRERAAKRQDIAAKRTERDQYAAQLRTALDGGTIDTETALLGMKEQQAARQLQALEEELAELENRPLLSQEEVRAHWQRLCAAYRPTGQERRTAALNHLRAAAQELNAVGDIQGEAWKTARQFRADLSACGVTDLSACPEGDLSGLATIGGLLRREIDALLTRYSVR